MFNTNIITHEKLKENMPKTKPVLRNRLNVKKYGDNEMYMDINYSLLYDFHVPEVFQFNN